VEYAACQPLLVAFPSPSPLGGATKPTFFSRLVYLQFAWGTAHPRLSCRVCHTSATVASLLHSKLAWGGSPHLILQQASLFTVCLGKCLSPFLWSSRCPALFATCLFFSFLFIIQFFFFAGQGSVCPGGYADLSQEWLWGYHVPLICLPVGLRLPSRLGAGVYQRGNPPGFSMYHGAWKLCVGWGCKGVLSLHGGFPDRCVSSISARFLL
jgi:hypothetical protein